MKALNLIILLTILVLSALIGYELWTGQAIRNPGPFIQRATQPAAFWWYVGLKVLFVVGGVAALISDRKKI